MKRESWRETLRKFFMATVPIPRWLWELRHDWPLAAIMLFALGWMFSYWMGW